MHKLLKNLRWPTRWTRRWEETGRACGLVSCPNPKSHWIRIWRRPNGAFLQGIFYCQTKCRETALLEQLARLYPSAPAAPPSNRIPLGLLMVARGWLTHEQVVMALAAQQSTHSGKIGDWFEKLGFATEQQVTSALGLQWGCPVASSLNAAAIPQVGGIPLGILEAFQMLPLHFVPATNTLYIAFGERVDHAALYTIEKLLDCRAQPCVRGRKSVAAQLHQMRQQPRPHEVEFGPMYDCTEIGRVCASYMARLGAEDARIGRVGQFIWLRLTVRASHTDLLFRLGVESQTVQNMLSSPLPAGIVSASAEALP